MTRLEPLHHVDAGVLNIAYHEAGPAEGPRDVFAYVIHEGKVRAPAAAMEFIKRVDSGFEIPKD